jgi:hypothetical protein
MKMKKIQKVLTGCDDPTEFEMDWALAEKYLKEVEQIYTEIGSAGYLALHVTIRPLRDRYNKGERTAELYDEIMTLTV